MARCWLLLIVLCALLAGADRKPAQGKTSNDTLELAATAYLERQDVRRAVGADLEDVIAVIEVRLTPKPGSKLALRRDDFELRSDKDGQHSQPFQPSQIAGSGVLVVSSTGDGGVSAENRGRVWGPPMGGRPRQVGSGSPTIGNTASDGAAAAQAGPRRADNPLLAILESKILLEKEVTEPASGLLYFFLEGRHKPKDLELIYRGPAGKLSVRFKE